MLTEKDWAVLESCPPYEKSKLLAEQSAWEFVKNLPGMMSHFIAFVRCLLLFEICLPYKVIKSVASE